MITSPEAPQQRTGRIVRLAVAASLLVHVLAFLVLGAFGGVARLPQPVRRPPDDETVMLSTALRIDKRTRADEAHRSRSTRAPRAAIAPHRVAAIPAKAAPPVRRHELAIVRHAPPRPLSTEKPTAAPGRTVRSPGERVALAAPAAPLAPSQTRPDRPSRYTSAQLARIENDLAKSIADDRARDNPLSNVKRQTHPSTSAARAAIDFSGVEGRLNGFQGLCVPLRSWSSGAYVHFYVTCRTTHTDGSVRQEAIPWPLTYSAARIAYDVDGPVLPAGEVPPPEPGWHPDPTERIDPDVIRYLRRKGYRL